MVATASVLGFAFPPAWREILQRPSWFRRGWLESDVFLELLLPHESVGVHWDDNPRQSDDVATFMDQVENGTFVFHW